MPFLFQSSAFVEQSVKQELVNNRKSSILNLSAATFVRREGEGGGTYMQMIIPVNQGALKGENKEKLTEQLADEILRLTQGMPVEIAISDVKVRDVVKIPTLAISKECVVSMQLEQA